MYLKLKMIRKMFKDATNNQMFKVLVLLKLIESFKLKLLLYFKTTKYY